MLRDLLVSVTRLQRPDAQTVDVVLVENGGRSELSDLPGEFRGRGSVDELHYVFEPQIGIVRARNAALDFLADRDYTLNAFVDDDETVDPSWLVELVAEMDRAGADLVGGPVRPFTRRPPASLISRRLWRSYAERSAKLEKRCASMAAAGQSGRVLISTNNWLMRTKFWRDNQMRFDIAYNLSGGEDMDFYFRAKSRGAVTSWAPRAVVMEEIPQARLSVGQQFARAREKAIFSYRKKSTNGATERWWRLPLDVSYKAAAGLLLTLLAIPTNGRTLLAAIRAFGTAEGSILGAFGRRTSPYADVVGE